MDDSSGSTGHPVPALTLPLLAAAGWHEGLAPVLLASLFVLAVSFVCSMTEAAFLTFPVVRAHTLEQSPSKMERLAGRLRIDFSRPLATIVIANNVANIAGSALTGYAAAAYFETQGWAIQTAVAVFTAVFTLVVILLGEIVPKTIGEKHSPAIVMYAAYPLRGSMWLMTPMLAMIGHLQRPFARTGAALTSEAEIAHLASIGQEQGAIEQREEDMIHRVLKLNDITAEDIMTPRPEMIALSADRKLRDVAEDLGTITRSLIPLYRQNRDDVTAILDRMDALLALAKDQDVPLTDPSISFKPYFVPWTMPADVLLVKLQRRTEHLAIVVGEYGETVGLVTLEDVLEEVVGEIYDEEDIGVGDGIQVLGDGEVLVLGASEVKDVNERLGTDIPNHRTVAGLLLDAMERIPTKGETFEAHGVTFRIEEVNDRAILKVRVTRKMPELTPEEAAERADD